MLMVYIIIREKKTIKSQISDSLSFRGSGRSVSWGITEKL